MAASLAIEEERGSCARSTHPHTGYYAGHFGDEAAGARCRSAPTRPHRPPIEQSSPPTPRRQSS
jgi:hypothetical protein